MSEDKVLEEAIISNAELIENLLAANEAPTSYDEHGLEWLEKYILVNRDNYSEHEKNSMINAVGAFLGECVRRKYGGQWLRNEHGIVLEIDGLFVLPFHSTARVIEGEPFKSIVTFYRAIPYGLKRPKEESSAEDNEE